MPRLLERLDAEASPVLSGTDLTACPAGAVDALLGERLLKELAPLEELSSCDCAVDGCYRTIQRDGAKAWAFCANGIAAPLEMDPEHLRQFRVEVVAFCQKLREANKLDGDAITEFTRTVCFLGRIHIGDRHVPVVLARCLRPRSAQSALFEIRGRLNEKPVIILTPTPRSLDLHILHHFQADGLVLAAVSHLLTNPGKLALDRQKLESLLCPARPTSSKAVVVRLDVGKSLCYFRGAEVKLSKMPFDVLVLLAREAVTGPGWVSRDRIFETCWHDDWEKDVAPEDSQIAKMVSEIRKALRASGGISSEEARSLVRSKSKVGYRLSLHPEQTEVL